MKNSLKFYIDGTWVKPNSNKTFDVINPATEQSIGKITLGNDTDADMAIAAAKRAFSTWSALPLEIRLGYLEKLLDVYEQKSEQMAQTISQEMGAPMDLARDAQSPVGGMHLSDAIREARSFAYQQQFSDNTEILKQPIGVCALITPWNWPMNQIMLKISPALATGCTVVLKPSELSPFCAMLLTEMIDIVGFPAGVFNLVNGDGQGVGSRMSGHPDIDMVSFTGSTRAGTAISKNAADTIKRVSLELGGKGANIIFADADEDAVTRGIQGCFLNTGQSCNAPTRMLVERPIYDKAVKMAKQIAQSTTVDCPSKDGTHLGPVVSKTQYNKVQHLIQTAIDEGATLVTGGIGKPENFETGYFVRPTVFADVKDTMTLWREEVFGPVLSITPFDTEQQAISMANDTVYGLTNYIQTTDKQKFRRVSMGLHSGMVEINASLRTTDIPFGGYKQSGNGREGGKFGIEDFLETKAVIGWY